MSLGTPENSAIQKLSIIIIIIQAVDDMATRSGRDASPKKEEKEEVITYDNYLKVSSPILTPL